MALFNAEFSTEGMRRIVFVSKETVVIFFKSSDHWTLGSLHPHDSLDSIFSERTSEYSCLRPSGIHKSLDFFLFRINLSTNSGFLQNLLAVSEILWKTLESKFLRVWLWDMMRQGNKRCWGYQKILNIPKKKSQRSKNTKVWRCLEIAV